MSLWGSVVAVILLAVILTGCAIYSCKDDMG